MNNRHRSMVVRVSAICVIAACSSACTISESCDLFNNTGSDLTIVRVRHRQEEPQINLKAGASVSLQEWLFSEYRVEMGGKVFRYAPKSPDVSFVVGQGFGPWTKRVFKAQIESSGHIFVLRPTQSVPAAEFVEQPSGFPLLPQP